MGMGQTVTVACGAGYETGRSVDFVPHVSITHHAAAPKRQIDDRRPIQEKTCPRSRVFSACSGISEPRVFAMTTTTSKLSENTMIRSKTMIRSVTAVALLIGTMAAGSACRAQDPFNP